jgi:hypothetical protein
MKKMLFIFMVLLVNGIALSAQTLEPYRIQVLNGRSGSVNLGVEYALPVGKTVIAPELDAGISFLFSGCTLGAKWYLNPEGKNFYLNLAETYATPLFLEILMDSLPWSSQQYQLFDLISSLGVGYRFVCWKHYSAFIEAGVEHFDFSNIPTDSANGRIFLPYFSLGLGFVF